MFIDKTDGHLHADVIKTFKELFGKEITVLRIRYVKDWSYLEKENGEDVQFVEPGYIVEYDAVDTTSYRKVLFGDSEMFVKEELPLRKYEHHLGKDFLCYDLWYEFPVIWGELSTTFDDVSDYQSGGKYESKDYYEFGTKYEDI